MKVRTNLLRDIKKYYLAELEPVYGLNEAKSLLNILIEHFFDLSKVDQLLQNNFRLTETEMLKIHFAVKDLKKEKPIQYIIGETEFFGMKIKLNPSVLIPRPETEELILLIKNEYKKFYPESILDIGTGSGCIALTLKKIFGKASVSGIDISDKALKVAKENSRNLMLDVNFSKSDILNENKWNEFGSFDLIVSNPPYVTDREKEMMKKNVLENEPHIALFVENNRPLIFYDKISDFALQNLNNNGHLWFEINEKHGKTIEKLLKEKGFSHIMILKDINGKDRFVKCEKK